jgi:purine-binding chemotaxis protein CheW
MSAGLVEAAVFRLAGEFFALRLEEVEEVVLAPTLTPVPMAPPALAGVTAVRGGVVAVVDLKAAWGLGGTAGSMCMICRVGGDRLALAVDSVEEIAPLEVLEGTAAPADPRGPRGPLAAWEGQLVRFLDVKELARLPRPGEPAQGEALR